MTLRARILIDTLIDGDVFVSFQDVLNDPMIIPYINGTAARIHYDLSRLKSADADRIRREVLSIMLYDPSYMLDAKYTSKVMNYLEKARSTSA